MIASALPPASCSTSPGSICSTSMPSAGCGGGSRWFRSATIERLWSRSTGVDWLRCQAPAAPRRARLHTRSSPISPPTCPTSGRPSSPTPRWPGGSSTRSSSCAESLTGRVELEQLSENSFGSLLPARGYFHFKGLADFLFALAAAADRPAADGGRRHCHSARQPGAGAVPPEADRPRRPADHRLQVPDDAAGRDRGRARARS